MRLLNHPHIVKLFEVLATKTKIYFVMEYVKGGELFDKVAKGRFSEDLSRRYFQQLISAISYCHSHGVFHRDLKPENVLLDENGDLRVSDFGLSAVTSQIGNDGMLHTLCGTPAYVAPEILAKQGYDGAKIDVWSSGVILFVLNAGYLPFNDQNLMAMYRKIYTGSFRVPRWTSPDMKRFISRLLDPNPETRITVDGIVNDPWFKKGYHTNVKAEVVEGYFGNGKDEKGEFDFLNAFDLISYSSGLDLSHLFPESNSFDEERFISNESPEKLVEKIEQIAKRETETVTVTTKGWNILIKGQKGNLLLTVCINRLTEDLSIVEVRSFDDISGKKLRDLIKCRESPVLSESQ
ncbi:hypothetical protein GIB67_041176 [Kingdonia uniflora]|uniref:non-specific serine/threonine protein kinase n=1 Tax=Kingdonia uniflora TaxID=39325 RepID=A0A7J7LKQ8_9MAGN|nr:hypothetical protein GIB67_041176 [Kingdonia uniflora]